MRRLGNPAALLAIADATILLMAFFLAVGLRFNFDLVEGQKSVGELWPRALSFSWWMLLGLLSMGLYRGRQRPTPAEMVVRVTLGTAIGGVFNTVFFYVVPSLTFGRGVMLIAIVISVLGLLALRVPMLRMLDASPMKRRIIVIGAGQMAAKIAQLRRRSDRRRFEVVAYIAMSETERIAAIDAGLAPILAMDNCLSIQRVDEIVVAMDDRRGSLPIDFLLDRKQRGAVVSDIVDFLERETERIDLEVLRPSWLLYEDSSQSRIFYHLFTRGLDLAFATTLLLLLAPLFLLVIAAIKLEDGMAAPVFYRQRRVGRNGRIFHLVKFRSMRVNAESNSGPRFATAGDDRVTRVGRLIRRFRIDELPQLINIIRGNMSVVGPRPERPEFVDELSKHMPLYFYRHCVRPGLTGWAQINFPYGASLHDAREKLKYDLYYIKNATIIMDLLILVQTAEIVIWGRGTTMSRASRRTSDGGEARPGALTDASAAGGQDAAGQPNRAPRKA